MRGIIGCASFLLVFMLGACVPQHLQKYVRRQPTEVLDQPTDAEAAPSAQASSTHTTQSRQTRSVQRSNVQKQNSYAQRPTIYAIDPQTFRFNLPHRLVWQAAINVLLKNYNLNIIDNDAQVVTTEWDRYYLNDGIYRNKISIKINALSRSQTEMLIHNSVEKLQSHNEALSGLWLPTDESQQEINRIVQNMAILLNQPPPVLPNTAPVAQQKHNNSKATY